MARLDRRHQWIQDELEAALSGEIDDMELRVDGETVYIEGRIAVDSGPEETREFLEALAAEVVPGFAVHIDGVFASRDIPKMVIYQLKKAAQTPQDIYFVEKVRDTPLKVRAHVRHQDKFLGKKRGRLGKAADALRADGVEVEAVPLGKQVEVSALNTLPALQEWLQPLLADSPLRASQVHSYKADSGNERLNLLYDADVAPESLRGLAQALTLKTDVAFSFEQRMSKARAREHIEAALKARSWIEGYYLSFQERTQTFAVTVDAEQRHQDALLELGKLLEAETQTKVALQIDVARDVMATRMLDTFPEDGIVTGLRHIDAQLYDIEAAIPFDHGNEQLQAWSDQMEAVWGAKIMISPPFLRAPDLRFRHLLGEDEGTIARRYNRPKAFSEAALEQAERSATFDIEEQASMPWRRDIRETVVVSIDPERTKDIDDALSVVQLDDGLLEVGVHIADVAHFVPQGTALDFEALTRGFTTYLKEGEIPVLPVVIANQAASLHGNTDRLAVSVFMRLSPEGELASFEVAKTVIHNHCRFAYAGAQAILDGKDDGHPFAWHVTTLGDLSVKMRRLRKESGALDLSLDDDPDKASHQLIEEFMLLANECVGRYLREGHPEHLCLYRTHPDVAEVSFEGLNSLSEKFRLGVQVRDQGSMQKALEAAMKTDSFDIFRFHVGRTLEKAVYHVEQLGHGALAKEDYAHFTSPIRRYTDLIIHRLIEDVLFSEQRGHTSCYDKEEMRNAIDHLNMMEIRVDAASFESHRLSDLQQYDGARRTYDGRILSFMRGWVTVKLHATDLLVKVRYRDFNATADMPISINDELTNRWYSLGDEVRVRTEGVDWGSKSIKAQLMRS